MGGGYCETHGFTMDHGVIPEEKCGRVEVFAVEERMAKKMKVGILKIEQR